jgi:hypothetical protein
MNEEKCVTTPRLTGSRLLVCWQRLGQYTCKTVKGHPLACLGVGLSLVLGGLSITMLAQRSSAAATPDELGAGIAIYQQGEFRLAQAVFAEIRPSDPAYGVAQAYALCRYELCRGAGTNDYRWFLSALESPVLASAGLAPELREELAFKERKGTSEAAERDQQWISWKRASGWSFGRLQVRQHKFSYLR